MKTALIAFGFVVAFAGATLAAIQSPIPQEAESIVVQTQAKRCPQKNFKACVARCHGYYAGTNCDNWCRARCPR
jgi:hypothetical protein